MPAKIRVPQLSILASKMVQRQRATRQRPTSLCDHGLKFKLNGIETMSRTAYGQIEGMMIRTVN